MAYHPLAIVATLAVIWTALWRYDIRSVVTGSYARHRSPQRARRVLNKYVRHDIKMVDALDPFTIHDVWLILKYKAVANV